MTLDVQLGGLRAAARAMGTVMAVGDLVAEEWGSRAIAVFGHRPYVGVSASVIAAEQLPGWDVDDIRARVVGRLTCRFVVADGTSAAARRAARSSRQGSGDQTGFGIVATLEGRHPRVRRGRDGPNISMQRN